MTTKQRRRRLERRGRPRKANARSRATTLAGRRAPDDLGTTELRHRKIRATTRSDIEVNGAGALYGRGHLDAQQYDTLGTILLWLERLARGWAGTGGCHALWMSITGALVPTGFVRPENATASGLADGARRQLERALRRLDGSRELVVALAEGRAPPIVLHAIEDQLTRTDKVELERLRQSLDHLAGRPPRSPAAHSASKR
jgi:hypothetical protein